MPNEPVLSICVPSRNRQIYFQETIRSLLASARDDVEFVFADNSDDPAIMDGFMRAHARDPRIRYLPSEAATLSMMDNWERAVSAATGRYVTCIGDDDYLDPGLAGFIVNLEREIQPDAIAWTGPNYIWPSEGSPTRTVSISLRSNVTRFDKRLLLSKAFHWEGCSHVPLSGFSIYHGALSRSLLDKVRLAGHGRYFEFPIIDYEMAFKAILLGETFIHVARPFSVLGACPLSNSVTIGRVEEEKKGQAAFFRELGRDMNEDDWLEGTPFRTWHGITACIYLVQHWLAKRFGLTHQGYERNLVRAMAANCALYGFRDDFDLVVRRYRDAIATWNDGAYLNDFTPVFNRYVAPIGPRFTGVTPEATLLFPDNIAGARSPGKLFHIFEQLLVRPEDIEIRIAQAAGNELAIGEAQAA